MEREKRRCEKPAGFGGEETDHCSALGTRFFWAFALPGGTFHVGAFEVFLGLKFRAFAFALLAF
jgi:hypothetical protein